MKTSLLKGIFDRSPTEKSCVRTEENGAFPKAVKAKLYLQDDLKGELKYQSSMGSLVRKQDWNPTYGK